MMANNEQQAHQDTHIAVCSVIYGLGYTPRRCITRTRNFGNLGTTSSTRHVGRYCKMSIVHVCVHDLHHVHYKCTKHNPPYIQNLNCALSPLQHVQQQNLQAVTQPSFTARVGQSLLFLESILGSGRPLGWPPMWCVLRLSYY